MINQRKVTVPNTTGTTVAFAPPTKSVYPITYNADYRTVMGNDHYLPYRGDARNPEPMKRIVIIGSSGSGKSTLARELGGLLQMPVIHLDRHFWRPGWIPTDHVTWCKMVQTMVQQPRWIIDGNYRGTLNLRLQTADTVIFLDLPRLICMWRAVKRRIQYVNSDRPDIASGCDEQVFDPSLFNFLRRIWNYPYRARPDVARRLLQLRPDQQLLWLQRPRQVSHLLASLQTSAEMVHSHQ
jgi:adenylate kinase family enzyme